MAIADLNEWLTWFTNENSYKKPGTTIKVTTVEGKKPVMQAIEYLKKKEPMWELQIGHALLITQGRSHADWCSSTEGISHESPLTGNTQQRIEKIVKKVGYLSENIGANLTKATGKDIILQLVIDDGVIDWSHRDNIFENEPTHSAVGISDHKKFGLCSVISYYERRG